MGGCEVPAHAVVGLLLAGIGRAKRDAVLTEGLVLRRLLAVPIMWVGVMMDAWRAARCRRAGC